MGGDAVMNLNETRRFVIGALAHGMTFDDAFTLMNAAEQQKQERQAAAPKALSELIEQGVNWSMEEGADPTQIAQAIGTMGLAQGLPRSQVRQAMQSIGGLGSPAEAWTEDVQTNFDEELAPVIKNFQSQGYSIAEAREAAKNVALSDPQVAAAWDSLKPGFDAAVDTAWQSGLDPEALVAFQAQRQENLMQRAGYEMPPEQEGGVGQTSLLSNLLTGAAGAGIAGSAARGVGRVPGISGTRAGAALRSTPTVRSLPGRAVRPLSSFATEAGGQGKGLIEAIRGRMPGGVASMGGMVPIGLLLNEDGSLKDEMMSLTGPTSPAGPSGIAADIGVNRNNPEWWDEQVAPNLPGGENWNRYSPIGAISSWLR